MARLIFKLLFLVCIVHLGACSLSTPRPNPAGERAPFLVYKDQYVLRFKADGPWCPYPAKDCTQVLAAGNWRVIDDQYSPVKLVSPSDVVNATSSSSELVEYDPFNDACDRYNSNLFDCSPNYYLHTDLQSEDVNDPLYKNGSLWGIDGAHGAKVDAAWSLQASADDVIVAVIDTGANLNHPDLTANLWKNPMEIAGDNIDNDHNGYIDDVYGVDLIKGVGSAVDDNGHGSHVSGTICAVKNNNFGIAGVGGNCKILPIKFLGASGGGSLYNAVRAIDYAIDIKKRFNIKHLILSNSWGGGGGTAALRAAIDRAQEEGLLFIAAAGNDGQNIEERPHFPSGYSQSNIISVASIDPDGSLSYFSNYGDKSVDLAAPGANILSLRHDSDKFAYLSGTSMATPHVSGVAALLYAKHPEWTSEQVKAQLLNSAQSTVKLQGKLLTNGQLDAYAALQESGESSVARNAGAFLAARGYGGSRDNTCKNMLSFFEGSSHPELFFVWNTFGTKGRCIKAFTDKFKDRPHTLHIYSSNETCRAKGNCYPHEFFANMSVTRFNQVVGKQKKKSAIKKLKKRYARILKRCKGMGNANTNCRLVPSGLESRFNAQTTRYLFTLAKESGWQLSQLVFNPVSTAPFKGDPGTFFFEHHGMRASLGDLPAGRGIVSLDGSFANFCDFKGPSNGDRISESDVREWYQRFKSRAHSIAAWCGEWQGLRTDSGSAPNPRERRFTVSSAPVRTFRALAGLGTSPQPTPTPAPDGPHNLNRCSKVFNTVLGNKNYNATLIKESDHGGLVTVFAPNHSKRFLKVSVVAPLTTPKPRAVALSFSGWANPVNGKDRQHWRKTGRAWANFENNSVLKASTDSGMLCWKLRKAGQRQESKN